MGDGESSSGVTGGTEEDGQEIPDEGTPVPILGDITIADVLTLILAVVFLIALAGVIYIALTPQQATDPYTEFYILGSEGNASDYPTNPSADEEISVIVGVVNHEHRAQTYRLAVRAENRTLTTRTIELGSGQRWEEPVAYSIPESGQKRVRFLLYTERNPSPETVPYRILRLWTNVSAAG